MPRKTHTKSNYVFPKIVGKRLRKSVTVPDQSMSLRTILDRYSRNMSVSVIQREAVYLDQSEYDMEQMSRMDFAEKAAMADELEARAQEIVQQLKDDDRRRKTDAADRAQEGQPKSEKTTGSKTLDNTMPVDTTHTTK